MTIFIHRFKTLSLYLGLAVLAVFLLIGPVAHAEIVLGGRTSSGTLDNSGTNKILLPLVSTVMSATGVMSSVYRSPHTICHRKPRPRGQHFHIRQRHQYRDHLYRRVCRLAGRSGDLQDHRRRRLLNVAPLYRTSDELGNALVSIGNGVTRGQVIAGGWAWTNTTTSHTWGTNNVEDFATDPAVPHNSNLVFNFDRHLNGLGQVTNPDEVVFSGNDSGGPTFVYNPTDARYELGGINSAVDFVATTSGSTPLARRCTMRAVTTPMIRPPTSTTF